MLRKIAIAMLALVTFVLVGGSIGLNMSEPRMVSDQRYGTSPAHRCVAQSQHTCGLYTDPAVGLVEVPLNARTTQREIVRIDGRGNLVWRNVQIAPRALTERQIEAAFASRADWASERAWENAARGAEFGVQVWGVVMLAGLVVALIDFLRRHLGAMRNAAHQSAQSVQEALRPLSETAALRAEVRKTELLARKAVAEAKLRREDPDVDRHDVSLNVRSSTAQ